MRRILVRRGGDGDASARSVRDRIGRIRRRASREGGFGASSTAPPSLAEARTSPKLLGEGGQRATAALKRLKSLFDLGTAPNRDPVSVRSWIYAKLLAVLLMERLGEESRLFSPWGFPFGGGESLARIPRGMRFIPARGLAALLSEQVASERERVAQEITGTSAKTDRATR